MQIFAGMTEETDGFDKSNPYLNPTSILLPQGGGDTKEMDSLFRGNDKEGAGMTYFLFAFLPEFKEEGHKDTHK